MVVCQKKPSSASKCETRTEKHTCETTRWTQCWQMLSKSCDHSRGVVGRGEQRRQRQRRMSLHNSVSLLDRVISRTTSGGLAVFFWQILRSEMAAACMNLSGKAPPECVVLSVRKLDEVKA
ncbi:potential fungal transcription factor [Pseudozyma hubeiensis SY62]|uniref:Potential fungal transcription factor n=1 Tax=Pseudozyma hubeiensis (strain SY62) TaxID=1305764 RepID=R9PJZ4_PSEHS|nr:potential fungal transcription factor [Pseudozyma hubeiensis SY62]GAC98415.1 potential fungal transcription factor [Pseudozyma hubeiensis SY62]